ncbi:TonB-dependent receptor [Fusobacterium sp.]|uniref:TonB-dependent receptor n=1 Tax=Fusobacterium sp. TaxID=68766 RepID=UPI0025BB0DB8|nr:TonB-dependent receptor [Fusobacterium sp.]
MKKILLLTLIISAISYAENQAIKLNKTYIKSQNGFEETLQNTPKNIQVITQKDIEEKNYKDVFEILENSPLITVQNNAIGQTIEMRGSGLNSKGTVQVMVDGMSLNPVDLNHGILPLNSIPVSNIEKVEILPGGNGVLFGDGATGGVINIITKNTIDKNESYIGARYGSHNEKVFKAGTATKVNDNLALIVNYQNENSKTNRDGEVNKNYNIDVTGIIKIDDKSDLSLRYAHYEKDMKSADLLTRDEWKKDASQSGVDFTGDKLSSKKLPNTFDILSKNEIKRDDISASYKRKLTDNLEFNLNANWQKTSNKATQKAETQAFFDEHMSMMSYYADYNGTFTEEKFKLNPSLKYNYDKNSYFILGYDYKLQSSKRDFDNFMDMYKLYNLDSEKESHGAYVFNKTAVGNLEFIQGYRREWTKFDTIKNSHYHHKVAPSFANKPPIINNGYVGKFETSNIKKSMVNDSYELAVNYIYSDTGNIYTRFEKSFRTPAPTEFQDKNPKTGYKINNLDAETNQTFEIGLKDYLLGSVVQLNAFAGRTKGEIYYNEISHGKEWKYHNLDETERKGIELNLTQEYGKLFFFEGFSYVDAKISKDKNKGIEGNYVPYASKLNANIGSGINWTDKFNTIFTFNYKDGYYLDRENNHKTRSNITLDLTANYVMDNGLKLYGGINNLLNRQNFEQEALEKGVRVYDPASERSYYAGFEYRF